MAVKKEARHHFQLPVAQPDTKIILPCPMMTLRSQLQSQYCLITHMHTQGDAPLDNTGREFVKHIIFAGLQAATSPW